MPQTPPKNSFPCRPPLSSLFPSKKKTTNSKRPQRFAPSSPRTNNSFEMTTLLVTALWAILLFSPAQAGTYAGYTATGLIPFLEADEPGLGFNDDVHVQALFARPPFIGSGSGSIPLYVDTGTCGVLISATDIPGWTGTPPVGAVAGWHYLSSSSILYNGYWITKDLYFNDVYEEPGNTTSDPGTGPVVVIPRYIRTRTPILAVTAKTNCTDYDTVAAGPTCAGTPLSPSGVRIMGIGFGRTHDGQPQGTPDKNPFLHVASIASRTQSLPPVQTGTFWPGYIISKQGITVGLTDANTASMAFARLETTSGGATTQHWTDLDTVDWQELPACIKITAPGAAPGGPTPCEEGTALLDLGTGNSFVRVKHDTVDHDNINDPLPRSEATQLLNTGTHVQIRFGNPAPGAADAHFTVGMSSATDPRPVTPERVRAVYARSGGGRDAFINTSRYMYRRFVVAFDPVLGRMGFRLTPVLTPALTPTA